MASRLYRLYFLDHKTRLVGFAAIAMFSFAYGALSNMVFKRDERQVTWEVIAVIVILNVILAAWYALPAYQSLPALNLRFNKFKFFNLVWNPALAFLSMVLVIVAVALAVIPFSSKLEAANVRKQLIYLSALDQKTFAASLPTLQEVLENPAAQIKPNKQTIRLIAIKLRQTKETSIDYWTTVATIINYQSRINQMSGEAPDPSSISRPCLGFTKPSSSNQFMNFSVSGCVVDLDTQTFVNATFKNSVIRYSGGETTLRNVTFVNCTFLLDLSSTKTNPEKPALLLALLDSPDQRTIKIE